MRFAPVLAASFAAVLSACAQGGGEPLSNLPFDTELQGESARARTVTGAGSLEDEGVAVDAPADEQEQPAADPLIAEVRATVDFASLTAFAAADAGLAHDRVVAEQRAVELADAAALVAQRVNEMHASSAGGGCAGGSELGGDVAVDPAVDDAALFSALAAEAAGNIASELNPPSETVCSSGGCHSVCETVPGTVDEIALGAAIDAATDAGEGCAATGEVLAQ